MSKSMKRFRRIQKKYPTVVAELTVQPGILQDMWNGFGPQGMKILEDELRWCLRRVKTKEDKRKVVEALVLVRSFVPPN